MSTDVTTTFDEVLEAVDRLPDEAQADLIGIVRRRLVERGHARLPEEVRRANEEYAAGHARRQSVDDLMNEIVS